MSYQVSIAGKGTGLYWQSSIVKIRKSVSAIISCITTADSCRFNTVKPTDNIIPRLARSLFLCLVNMASANRHVAPGDRWSSRKLDSRFTSLEKCGGLVELRKPSLSQPNLNNCL